MDDENVDVIKLHSKNLGIRFKEIKVKHCYNKEQQEAEEAKLAGVGSREDSRQDDGDDDDGDEQQVQPQRRGRRGGKGWGGRMRGDRFALMSGGKRYLPILSAELIEEYDFLVIKLKEKLLKDTVYELYIPFAAELSDSLIGYYKSSYYDKKLKTKKFLTITQFEPNYARRAFPCFDEPEFKAKFEISLAHAKEYTALSNMPIKWSEPLEGKSDWCWDHFEESVPMSTYLVAYGINCFAHKDGVHDEGDNVHFKVWARPDAIDQVDYAKVIGPKVLNFYEDYFGLEFPLPKIDMIAIPDFASGAMENFGLITYRETALLYQPNISSSSSQFRVASVISHELVSVLSLSIKCLMNLSRNHSIDLNYISLSGPPMVRKSGDNEVVD